MFEKMIGFFQKSKNKKDAVEIQRLPKYEVLEKSKSNDWEKSMINYSALIQLNEDCDLKLVAKELQEKMGYHPYGYDCFDLVTTEADENKVQLNWKSWNYCD